MDWINYHHLLYFWTVLKEGSISSASQKLKISQPAISTQLKVLEGAIGNRLYTRQGKKIVPTDIGWVLFKYADEIFSLGQEMMDVVKGQPNGRPLRFVVGITGVLPKTVCHKILTPVLSLPEKIQLICKEDRPESLLADLVAHEMDLILSDTPLSGISKMKVFHHFLGDCGVSFMAHPKLAKKYQKNFPSCLEGAPFLLPTENSDLRRSLEQWFETNQIRPIRVAEFEDSSLLKVFAKDGNGVFVVPEIIEKEVKKQFGMEVIGKTDKILQRFYAVSIEKKLKHPAVLKIFETAKKEIFSREE